MFILTKIADLVQIVPEDFEKDASLAIEDNINAKYANKVIQKIGLCVCLYDLLSASEGLIGHGTGLVNVNVEFRLIVFRPFKHEILIGRISSQNEQQIRIRTHFFTDIIIPISKLPPGTSFKRSEQLMVWDASFNPDTEAEQEEPNELFFDNHETVRFRIEEEVWTDQTPVGPREKEGEGDGEREKKSPYVLYGSMEDPGLGPCLWWDGEES